MAPCGSPSGSAATLVSGRLTFVLGVAIGARRAPGRDPRPPVGRARAGGGHRVREPGRRRLPRAGRRGLVAGRARAPGPRARGERRAAALLAVAALAPVLALGVLFPEGGAFPFAATSFWPALAGGGRARAGARAASSASCGPERSSTRSRWSASFVLRDADGRQRGAPGRARGRPGGGARRCGTTGGGCSRSPPSRCCGSASRAAVDDWSAASRDPSVHASLLPAAAGRAPRQPATPGASRSRSPTTTGRRAGWRRSIAWRAAGSASSTRPQRPVLHGRPLTAARLPRGGSTTTPSAGSRCPTRRSTTRRAAEAELRRASGLPYLREVWRDRALAAVRGPRRRAAGHRRRRRDPARRPGRDAARPRGPAWPRSGCAGRPTGRSLRAAAASSARPTTASGCALRARRRRCASGSASRSAGSARGRPAAPPSAA